MQNPTKINSKISAHTYIFAFAMSYKVKNICPLDDLCDIRFGYHATPSSTGVIPYLQIRHFNEEGHLADRALEMIDLDEKSRPHLLQEGDVLFVGKGNRLFSWEYNSTIGPLVASSTFFVLRADKTKILPSFLATLLNSPPFKAHLQQLGAGTNIFSIRKSELGAIELPIPPMDRQEKISTLAKAYQEEIRLAQQILDQKQLLFKGILTSLLK